MSNPHWTDRPEGGGRFAIWLIRNIALYGGRPIGRLFLYPITLYFYLRRRPERYVPRYYWLAGALRLTLPRLVRRFMVSSSTAKVVQPTQRDPS